MHCCKEISYLRENVGSESNPTMNTQMMRQIGTKLCFHLVVKGAVAIRDLGSTTTKWLCHRAEVHRVAKLRKPPWCEQNKSEPYLDLD